MTNTVITPYQPAISNFGISYVSLLQFSRMYRALFACDLKKFQELNPGLNRIYVADWLEATAAAKNASASKATLDMKRDNYSLCQIMASCRNSYKEIIYYAQAAF